MDGLETDTSWCFCAARIGGFRLVKVLRVFGNNNISCTLTIGMSQNDRRVPDRNGVGGNPASSSELGFREGEGALNWDGAG